MRWFRSKLFWGFLSYTLRTGINLITLPFALKVLSGDTMGLWYLFTGIGALVVRVDFGFNPTISRGLSYLLGGARSITPNSADERGIVDTALVGNYIRTVQLIYLGIVAVGAMVLLGASWLVVGEFADGRSGDHRLLAWLVYCVGLLINLYGEGWVALVTGANLVREAQQIHLLAFGAGALVTVTGLLSGWGLISLSVGFLVTGMILRAACWWLFRGRLPHLLPLRSSKFDNALLIQIWPAAWRTGLVALGAYLIYYSNTVLAAKFLGLEQAASYGLSFQAFQFALAVCGLPFVMHLPVVNQLRARGEDQQAWRQFLFRHGAGLSLFLAFCVALVFFGNLALDLLGSRTRLLPGSLLLFMGLIYALEFNHGYFATFVMTANEVPFVWPAVLSGLAIAAGGYFAVQLWGLWGLLLTVFLVQAAWNNWWVPLYAWRSVNSRVHL